MISSKKNTNRSKKNELVYLKEASKSVNKQLDEILKYAHKGELIIGTITKEGDAIFFAEKEDVYRFICNPETIIDIRELGLTYSECYDPDSGYVPLPSRYNLTSFTSLDKNEIKKRERWTKGKDKEEISIHVLVTTKKEWGRFKKKHLKPRRRNKIIPDKELKKIFSDIKKQYPPEHFELEKYFMEVAKKSGYSISYVKKRYYELYPKKK